MQSNVLNDLAEAKRRRTVKKAEALKTIERVAVMMGTPVNLMGKNYYLNLLRAMTAGISFVNLAAPFLRRKLKHKVLQSHLQILHSMILIIHILTPFTMTYTIHLFHQRVLSYQGQLQQLNYNQEVFPRLPQPVQQTPTWRRTLQDRLRG